MTTITSITLFEAVGQYVGTVKPKDQLQGGHQELYRFINWCGADRVLTKINPSEIGEFVERSTGTGISVQSTSRLQEVRRFLAYARKKGFIDINLAQHVRIRKGKSAGKGKLAISPDVIELTPDGHAQLVTQVEKLKAERAPLAVQIRNAAADADVRENAPLEAVREQLGYVESRIKNIEATLKASVVIDPSTAGSSETVGLGSKVSVKEGSGGKATSYTVVRANEASPLEGKISNESPVGGSLMGTKAGQHIQVETPKGRVTYRIVKVFS